ncbi:hypothetical protein J2S17_003189 [Cytobacillus purgationiresistens]|uniref:Uncharacterized protein n=1 Tax=Cytobacillus purgationiresistens TaxID=863449 RepID=A0ABU0AJ70_9BACI|nr:hypothetical protein [Cytobacillus purgationiresistens]
MGYSFTIWIGREERESGEMTFFLAGVVMTWHRLTD